MIQLGLCVQRISCGAHGGTSELFSAIGAWQKGFFGQPQRPDSQAMVASEMFEECANGIAAVAAAGVEALDDTNHMVLSGMLRDLKNCRTQPGCEARIRQLAPALQFCMEHDLDCVQQLGSTTGSAAASLCTNSHS